MGGRRHRDAWHGSADRTVELVLVLGALVICGYAYIETGLATSGKLPPGLAVQLACAAVLPLVCHVSVRRFAPHADPLILPMATLLSGLGLVLIHRLDLAYRSHYRSTAAAPGQLLWCAIAVVGFGAVMVLLKDHRRLQRYPYVTITVGLVLLMAPAFYPGDVYGAKRWIFLGPLEFQPGEFVKIIIVVFFAGYLTVRKDALALAGRRFMRLYLPRGRQLGPIAAVWILSLLVLIFERDLGTSLIFFGVFVIMLYTATERTSWVVFGVGMFAVGAFVIGSLEPHVHGRVVAWLHPMDIYLPPAQRPAGLVSDQAAQALFSFGSGGMLGTGLGQGHPELIGFAGRSDFILTTVGEELGLAGVTVVLLLYTLLAERGLRTAITVSDPFGKLLAAGLATSLVLQVFVVAGGVTGLIPLTGKALPFLAQGGSAMVANWLMIAVLIKVSDTARRPLPTPAAHVSAAETQIVRP
ncbi:cell division protein FtsW [Streptomyces hygroscopicus]|uniref:FtsW/RodA/SpoVE family cell cycle protein n=1 Tax=Streptomyces hygroscopicus TaxID=1912 RepID=UPI00223FFD82|nr:FtsW/RodA/SpoVE family cell cycle protein [Streptomyces hygroscopicus]MCW7946075.1 cell division protein FtsW [Streptomyces hygroscopicus]